MYIFCIGYYYYMYIIIYRSYVFLYQLYHLYYFIHYYLSIICISGILLALHYIPDINYSYYSVMYIIREVYYGWSLRYIHSNGASFVFIVLFIHIGRGLYYGSYYYNRLELLIDSFYTLSHNIIILISSYPFISLINCPWLLFIIILLSYSFISIIISFNAGIIIAINYWIRDVIREYINNNGFY